MPKLPPLGMDADAKSERVLRFYFDVPVEAPVLCPTVEEWANPVLYIEKIRESVEYGGICKIKPPIRLVSPFNNIVEHVIKTYTRIFLIGGLAKTLRNT